MFSVSAVGVSAWNMSSCGSLMNLLALHLGYLPPFSSPIWISLMVVDHQEELRFRSCCCWRLCVAYPLQAVLIILISSHLAPLSR